MRYARRAAANTHMTRISLKTARAIVLRSQLLDRSEEVCTGKEGVIQTIEKLGYVQIDPLSAIKRTHHHTFWTRVPEYHEEILDDLQSKNRKVFEYWGHALSFFPMLPSEYMDIMFCLSFGEILSWEDSTPKQTQKRVS